ncbi:MAG: indole-3-glycerol-phosphate synthase [Polyangiaceae bacterium]|nr:indole-3-glycerol-phosphate synthase [Polyangiaceae bacterium]
MSRLAAIIDQKAGEVRTMQGEPRTPNPRAPIDVARALARGPGDPLRLIAEVKLRSPSAGALSRVLSPPARAVAYAEAGAAMVSVLCDAAFFDGSWEHLRLAREALDARSAGDGSRRVPVLAKEFVVDARQVQRARDEGADAVLLIARIVSRQTLADLARAARAEGIEPLVEVVDESEVDAALAAEARVIGVNARDLDTLAMDAARAARVLHAIPQGRVALHLSGLREPKDVASIAAGRADAALIGEALMRDDDPRERLRSLVAAAAAPGS